MDEATKISQEHKPEFIPIPRFWCKACLDNKRMSQQSPDPRYCQGCFDCLVSEARMLDERGITKKADWMPKIGRDVQIVEKQPSGIMSTSNETLAKVDIIKTEDSQSPFCKRGPKHKQLPDELIKELEGKGMGSKAIATQLKAQGIEISYKTVQRRLSIQDTFRLKS